MTKAPPACTKCWTPLAADFLNIDEFRACPACNSMVRLDVFPAYFHEIPKGSSGEALLADTEASCFYHPQKRAAVVCGECGRFLCSLCDLEVESKHYCPSCLEAAKEKNKISSLNNRRHLYDINALRFALLSIIPWIGFFAAPIAVYLSIKHWNTPLSVVRTGSKGRFVAAVVLASVGFLGWALFLISAFWIRP